MSNANRVGLAYVVESTFGVTPSGPPTLKNLRWVSESLKGKTESISSKEVRSDRNTVDVIRTNVDSGGDINVELSYGAYDDLIEYALQSDATWTAAVDIAHNSATDNIVIASSGSNFTLTLTTTNWVTLGLSTTTSAGKWVRLKDFTTAANNGYAKIVSVGGSGNKVLTVSGLAMSAGTQSSGTVNIRQMSEVVTGVLQKTLAIEKSFTDVASEFLIYNGMGVNMMDLDVSIGQILTGKFGFMGKRETSAAATAGTGTNTAAPTNGVMNSIDNIVGIVQGSAAIPVTKFSMSLKNNMRARQQVGALGAVSLISGTIDVSGTVEFYFTAKTVPDLSRNFTATNLALVVLDSAGNAYVVDVPRCKFTDAEQVAGGINTDVIVKMQFTGYMHATELRTLRIARSAA